MSWGPSQPRDLACHFNEASKSVLIGQVKIPSSRLRHRKLKWIQYNFCERVSCRCGTNVKEKKPSQKESCPTPRDLKLPNSSPAQPLTTISSSNKLELCDDLLKLTMKSLVYLPRLNGGTHNTLKQMHDAPTAQYDNIR